MSPESCDYPGAEGLYRPEPTLAREAGEVVLLRLKQGTGVFEVPEKVSWAVLSGPRFERLYTGGIPAAALSSLQCALSMERRFVLSRVGQDGSLQPVDPDEVEHFTALASRAVRELGWVVQ